MNFLPESSRDSEFQPSGYLGVTTNPLCVTPGFVGVESLTDYFWLITGPCSRGRYFLSPGVLRTLTHSFSPSRTSGDDRSSREYSNRINT